MSEIINVDFVKKHTVDQPTGDLRLSMIESQMTVIKIASMSLAAATNKETATLFLEQMIKRIEEIPAT